MATRYWVGGNGTWNTSTTTNWSATSGGAGGASAPTSADDVIFDVNSNTGTTAFIVTISAAVCNDLSVTTIDASLTFGGTFVDLTISGNVAFTAGVPVTVSSTSLQFKCISATSKTYDFAGATAQIGRLLFDGVGDKAVTGSLQCLGGITINAGNVDFSGGTGFVSCTSFNASLLTSSYTITLGSKTYTIASGGDWDIGSGLLNAGTSTINASGANFYGGGKTYYNVSLTTAYTAIYIYGSGNQFNNFSLPGASGNTLSSVYFQGNITISGTFTIANAGQYNRRTFLRPLDGDTTSQITITAAAISAFYDIDFQNINAAGAAIPWSGTRFGNAGNNTNITFPAAKTVYLNASGNASIGFWQSYWATTSGGAISSTNFPLAQDTAIIDDNSVGIFPTTQVYFTEGAFNINTISCINTSSRPFTFNDFTANICGSGLTFSTFTSLANTSTGSRIYFNGVNATQSFNSASKTLNYLKISAPGSTVSLASNLSVLQQSTTTSGILVTSGTFASANYTVSAWSFTTTGTPTVTMGSSNFAFAGATSAPTFWTTSVTTSINAGTSTITLTPGGSYTKNFSGGGLNYNTLNFSVGSTSGSILNILGANTFSTITTVSSGSSQSNTIKFPANTVTKLTTLNVNGNSSGSYVYLVSSSSGTQATLQKTSGTWTVGANSVDNGNNSNLSFTGTNPDYLQIQDINGAVIPASTNFFAIL